VHNQFKYDKFLLGFEERRGERPLVFYVRGNYYVELLPKNYHINFSKIPVPVKC